MTKWVKNNVSPKTLSRKDLGAFVIGLCEVGKFLV
jgi:hypothetical protein